MRNVESDVVRSVVERSPFLILLKTSFTAFILALSRVLITVLSSIKKKANLKEQAGEGFHGTQVIGRHQKSGNTKGMRNTQQTTGQEHSRENR